VIVKKDLMTFGMTLALAAALVSCKSDNGEHRHDDHGTAEATHAVIQQGDVPDRVSSAFTKAYPKAKIANVSKETYADGTVHYEYEFSENGKEQEVELDANGEVLEKH
jgi:uncharacterized membrane protein YkoI